MKISLYTALFILIVFGSFSACNAWDNEYYETHCKQCETQNIYKDGLCMGCYDEKYNYDALCAYCETDILNTDHYFQGICNNCAKIDSPENFCSSCGAFSDSPSSFVNHLCANCLINK